MDFENMNPFEKNLDDSPTDPISSGIRQATVKKNDKLITKDNTKILEITKISPPPTKSLGQLENRLKDLEEKALKEEETLFY